MATDQINSLGIPADEAKTYASQVPIAYAVTYIWGTIGSAIILAQLGPKLLGIDLPAACKEYEAQLGAGAAASEAGISSAYRPLTMRAYRVDATSATVGKSVGELLPGVRIFAERVRRGGQIMTADASTVLQAGDVVAVSGPHAVLVETFGGSAAEVDDRELLDARVAVCAVPASPATRQGETGVLLVSVGFSPRYATYLLLAAGTEPGNRRLLERLNARAFKKLPARVSCSSS